MILIKSKRFNEELQTITLFIALDNPHRALDFFDDLIAKIEEIPLNPLMHRQRKSLEDKHSRELIFKGYTIPYYIDTEKETIVILGIFNQNQWKD